MTKRIVSKKSRGTKAKERPIPFQPTNGIERAAKRAGIEPAKPFDWSDESHTFGMARAAAERLARDGIASLDEAWALMWRMQLDDPTTENFYQEARRRLVPATEPTDVTIDRGDLHVVISELRDATLAVLDLMLDSPGTRDAELGRVLRTIHGANDLLVRADGGAT